MPATEGKSTYTLVGDWFVRANWVAELPTKLGDPGYAKLRVQQIGHIVAQASGDYVCDLYGVEETELGWEYTNGDTPLRTIFPKSEFFGSNKSSYVRLFGTQQDAWEGIEAVQVDATSLNRQELAYAIWRRADLRNERRLNYGDLGDGLHQEEETTSRGVMVEGLTAGQDNIMTNVLAAQIAEETLAVG